MKRYINKSVLIVNMDKSHLREIIVQQRLEIENKDTGIERECLQLIEKYISIPQAIIISGVRRSGKSTLLSQIISKWFDSNYYYLNFDDERLISFSAEKDFDSLYQIFIEEFDEHKTFFFDEIQNIKGWERFVRRMYDRGFKFFITGSNAHLLSKEIGTHLTGRHIMVTLYPFSFKEYLNFNNIHIDDKSAYITEKRAKIRQNLFFYLNNGGFPEFLKFGEPDVLRRLFNDILFRDIIVRYKIRETQSFQEITTNLLTNISNRVSYNRLKNLFHLGSANTAKNFVEYLETSFLIFYVNQFSYSHSKQIMAPKKVYCIDTGLRNNVAFRFSDDLGRTMENCVFLELLRRYPEDEIYYWDGKGEVDFVVKRGQNIIQLIQVCLVLGSTAKEREIKSLQKVMKQLGLKKAFIITDDFEGEETQGKYTIEYIPLWKWLLNL